MYFLYKKVAQKKSEKSFIKNFRTFLFLWNKFVAERKRFELLVPLQVHMISNHAPSANSDTSPQRRLPNKMLAVRQVFILLFYILLAQKHKS